MVCLVNVTESDDSAPEAAKVFEFLWGPGYADDGEAGMNRTCHRVRLDRLETTIGYLKRALHGASLKQGVRVPLTPSRVSVQVYLPRTGGLWGDGDLEVSALSGLPPRATVTSRLGRAYSTIRSGGSS